MELICEQCGKKFQQPRAWAKRTKRHFCSKKCYDVGQTSKLYKTCKVCGKRFNIPKCYDTRYSTCSKRCLKISRAKDNNPNWRGGVTRVRKAKMSTSKYRRWRKMVFERDGYTCQDCGKHGGHMNAHHVKSWKEFPKLRYKLSNGVTLCLTCHKKTYKYWRKDGIHRG